MSRLIKNEPERSTFFHSTVMSHFAIGGRINKCFIWILTEYQNIIKFNLFTFGTKELSASLISIYCQTLQTVTKNFFFEFQLRRRPFGCRR